MGTSFLLFRAFGIPVRVHWSFVLILAYGAFVFSAGPAGPFAGAFYGLLVIVLLFVCVTLHEFSHALAARRFDIGVKNIILLPIGGVANLERLPERPSQELWIAIAGPAINFGLAFLLLPFALWANPLPSRLGPAFGELAANAMYQGEMGHIHLLSYLVFTNLILGIFNLLPAFPMDGGRVLRALLAMVMAYVQATRIAVYVGRIIAVLLAVYGIYLWSIGGGGLMLLLVAFFVYIGGGAEREAVESRAVLQRVPVRQALVPDAVGLHAGDPLNWATNLLLHSYQTDFPVFDDNEMYVGVLTKDHLIQARQEAGPETRVGDVMLPADQVPVCAPNGTLADVWEMLILGGYRVVAVKDGSRFQGLITLDDLGRVFQTVNAPRRRRNLSARPAPPESTAPPELPEPAETTAPPKTPQGMYDG
jgi:Zn-dependent protease